MFTCDYDDFGMTFTGALVVVTNSSANFSTSGIGTSEPDTEYNSFNINYRIYVSQSAYDSNSNPIKESNLNNETVPDITGGTLKDAAYTALKALPELSTNITDV